MKNKIINLMRALSLAVLVGAGCGKVERKTLDKVGYGGFTYVGERGTITIVFYDKNGERYPLKLVDRDFDYEGSYSQGKYKQDGRRIQGIYNVEIESSGFPREDYAVKVRRENLQGEEESRLEREIEEAIRSHASNNSYYRPN
ncbi:MAG: hypothetical protein QXX68_00590 [Candidatus Pacearchaeota archaeon]